MIQIHPKSYLPSLPHSKPTSEHSGPRALVTLGENLPRESRSAERRRPSPEGRAIRLGHAHVRVRSLDRSLPFYCELLGLHLSERAGRFAFLAAGDEHHSIALEEVGDWAVNPSRRAVGVAHLAFQVRDAEAFAAIRNKLLQANLPLISRNNGISWAFRFKDPDRNEIEIYVDRRHTPGGTLLWGGRWHMPPQVDASAS